jgi:FixJ family two-component response regulator
MSVADNNNDHEHDEVAVSRLAAALKVVVVSTTLEVTESLMEMVESMAGASVEVIVGEIGGVDDSVLEHHDPDVLIVDLRLDSPTDMDSLRNLLQKAGSETCVIATAKESNIEGVRRLMRLGISDFLPQPISREDLFSALQHAARRARQSRPSEGAASKMTIPKRRFACSTSTFSSARSPSTSTSRAAMGSSICSRIPTVSTRCF